MAELISRRLQVVLTNTQEKAKDKTVRLTYGNIAEGATDEQLLQTAQGLATLQVHGFKQALKVDTTLLG